MADRDFTFAADDGPDDLPRTLRREHEARARAQSAPHLDPADTGYHADTHAYDDPYADADEPVPATVKRLEVPFFRLMFFFIKAVLAAIPALILLAALLWLAGDLLQQYYPEIVKMQILIRFPG